MSTPQLEPSSAKEMSASSLTRLLTKCRFFDYPILWLSLFYIAVMAPFTSGFLDWENLVNLLVALAPLFLVALGQTFVLITGGIDLSVTSVIGLVSVLGGQVLSGRIGGLSSVPAEIGAGLVVMVIVGVLVGCLNGGAVTVLRMPSFIVTLTGMMFFGGLAVWLTHSRNIGHLPATFIAISGNPWLALAAAAAVGGAAHLILTRSIYGRWMYAVGHNARASYISGVPVNFVKTAAYTMSGACAAVASIIYTGQSETASPILGQRILLDVIGATILGGTSLSGGRGTVLGTLLGVLFLKLVDNSLNLLSLSIFTITMVKGFVILLASFIDVARHRLAHYSQ